MSNLPLFPNAFYHVYNHANGADNLFREDSNYLYFLGKWREYTREAADTLAYCLMPNHFHFLIRIKNLQGTRYLGGVNEEMVPKKISQTFSNFFNAYSKTTNNRYKRYGSLFAQNFKRKLVSDPGYLKILVGYIHLNPVSHGFTKDIWEWPYSSIHQYKANGDLVWIEKNTILDQFSSLNDFIEFHHDLYRIKTLDDRYLQGIGNLGGAI